ncbi:MAG: class I SAM-dependent methyltransferase [Blastocatellia bacterium]|nr:class I SAM-dependent methyltransferase [Blastocatellia bacterium]
MYNCRFCDSELTHTFVDLGATPLANSYLKFENLDNAEPFFSLHVRVCESCFLVQLPALETPENIFTDYLYFSSFSPSWLAHAKNYCEKMTARFGLNKNSQVVEIASNDGYLLQYFVEQNIKVLGVEPAKNVAEHAITKGIPTITKFFGEETAKALAAEGIQADLTVANNVLAHVPDINDFVKGFAVLLKENGVATFEFPHLLNLVEKNQFDTIYHEHFSYLSLTTVEKIFNAHGLRVFDVENLPTHGGSLRVFATKGNHEITENVAKLKDKESQFGLTNIEFLTKYEEQVKQTKRDLLAKLIEIKNSGKTIVAYGAAAKGNTLMNYCGIKTDFIEYVCDLNVHKQSNYLPGTRIEIASPEKIKETKPDFVIILPWNLADEIMQQLEFIKDWNGKFIIPIPTVKIV